MLDEHQSTNGVGPEALPTSEESLDVVRYSWIADVPDQYLVCGFEGVEELNRPYHLLVRLWTTEETADPHAMLGTSVQLQLERSDNHLRSFCGLVRRVAATEVLGAGRGAVVEVVPALSTLGLTRQTRIFQEQTALEIVESILAESLATYERELDASSLDRVRYQKRDYCVQYQETNLDFVHRLLEEEGIGYYFEHDDTERLVLTDDNQQLARLSTMGGGLVPFETHDLIAIEEPITRFQPAKELASTRFTLRDHDWTRGRPTLEAARADEGAGQQHEVYEHGFGRHVTISEDNEILATLLGIAAGALNTDLLPHQYVGAVRSQIDLPGAIIGGFTAENTEHQARIRHELLLRDRSAAKGASRLIGLSPGRMFELVGHPVFDVDGPYFATKVVHTSSADDRVSGVWEPAGHERPNGARFYSNTFECRPVTTPWRPERRTPKPRIYGLQTATVSTPVGLDVHTDQHGRIKVKFNWDRTPTTVDGNDSCWIRVSQTWAGAGYPGFVFIPRSGMEVVVSFIDGDPDRPLVVGCVHNGRNAPPNFLPLQATKSVIRTRSVPHGPGYNELSFEDAMGAERIHVRAERDFTQHVLNDRSSEIDRHDTTVIRGNKSECVDGSSLLVARKGRSVLISGADTVTSEGPSYRTSRGTSTTTLHAGEEVLCVAGDRYVRIENGQHHLLAKGCIEQKSDEKVVLRVGNAELAITSDLVEISIGESRFQLRAESVIINGKTMPAPPPAAPSPPPQAEPRDIPPPPPSMDESNPHSGRQPPS